MLNHVDSGPLTAGPLTAGSETAGSSTAPKPICSERKRRPFRRLHVAKLLKAASAENPRPAKLLERLRDCPGNFLSLRNYASAVTSLSRFAIQLDKLADPGEDVKETRRLVPSDVGTFLADASGKRHTFSVASFAQELASNWQAAAARRDIAGLHKLWQVAKPLQDRGMISCPPIDVVAWIDDLGSMAQRLAEIEGLKAMGLPVLNDHELGNLLGVLETAVSKRLDPLPDGDGATTAVMPLTLSGRLARLAGATPPAEPDAGCEAPALQAKRLALDLFSQDGMADVAQPLLHLLNRLGWVTSNDLQSVVLGLLAELDHHRDVKAFTAALAALRALDSAMAAPQSGRSRLDAAPLAPSRKELVRHIPPGLKDAPLTEDEINAVFAAIFEGTGNCPDNDSVDALMRGVVRAGSIRMPEQAKALAKRLLGIAEANPGLMGKVPYAAEVVKPLALNPAWYAGFGPEFESKVLLPYVLPHFPHLREARASVWVAIEPYLVALTAMLARHSDFVKNYPALAKNAVELSIWNGSCEQLVDLLTHLDTDSRRKVLLQQPPDVLAALAKALIGLPAGDRPDAERHPLPGQISLLNDVLQLGQEEPAIREKLILGINRPSVAPGLIRLLCKADPQDRLLLRNTLDGLSKGVHQDYQVLSRLAVKEAAVREALDERQWEEVRALAVELRSPRAASRAAIEAIRRPDTPAGVIEMLLSRARDAHRARNLLVRLYYWIVYRDREAWRRIPVKVNGQRLSIAGQLQVRSNTPTAEAAKTWFARIEGR